MGDLVSSVMEKIQRCDFFGALDYKKEGAGDKYFHYYEG